MESLLAMRFREEVSKSKDYRMKLENEFGVGYPTGFLSFDFLNGTIVHVKSETHDFKYYSVGITDGSMVMVIGRSGCGKTTWCLQAGANIIRQYKTSCMFYDNIEGGVIDSRLEMLTKFGENTRERVIMRNTGITGENFYQRVKMVHDMKLSDREAFSYDTGKLDTQGNPIFKLEPTIYLLDSLALLMPEKYTDEDELSGQMSATAAARNNAAIFKRITPLLKAANIILMVINHINEAVAINQFDKKKPSVSYLKMGEALPGGHAPVYLTNLMIRFDDHDKLKEGEGLDVDGSLVDLTIVKSRSAKAGKSVTLVFNQDTGFDEQLSLFLLLKQNKKITGAGVSWHIEGSDIKFAQKNFKQKLAESKEFQEAFSNAVSEVLKDMIESRFKEDIFAQDNSFDANSSILNKLIA